MYRFQVVHIESGREIGSGRFETAPASSKDAPERFSFAIMSCNQPFNKNGGISRSSTRMLKALRRCLADHDVKYILMMGDQMYTDYPKPISLFHPAYFQQIAPPGRKQIQDCSAEEVRRLFQDRYRWFWNLPEWLAIHRDYPTLPILDDHDIVDNWGSDPAHATPLWHTFGEGARMAYSDYQGSRTRAFAHAGTGSFHYSFSYGHSATFVMDHRSQRLAGATGRIYSPEQHLDLKKFLAAHTEKKVLFLLLSVPAIHLPRFVSKVAARLTHSGEDFSDRWSTGAHIRDRDRLFELIHDHQRRNPRQKLILLSGDIHIGCAHQIQRHPAILSTDIKQCHTLHRQSPPDCSSAADGGKPACQHPEGQSEGRGPLSEGMLRPDSEPLRGHEHRHPRGRYAFGRRRSRAPLSPLRSSQGASGLRLPLTPLLSLLLFPVPNTVFSPFSLIPSPVRLLGKLSSNRGGDGMKQIFASFIFFPTLLGTLIVLLITCAWVYAGSAAKDVEVEKAVAVLHPTDGSDAGGVVFFEKTAEGRIRVTADVTGLEPGKHGFHIHEYGDCSAPDATSAGGHFDPEGKKHGAPADEERHVGDLGNIEAGSDGEAGYERTDKLLSFSGKKSIIGRAVVIHAREDDLTSQPTGNAGPRVACGVIGVAE
jgi:Cu/Zn superoxide dismutase